MRSRSRAWCFTVNNPSEDTVAQLCLTLHNFEYVFQLEKESTEHIQGVMRYPNPMDKWPDCGDGIHWERCRNWRASIKYCTKVRTRINGPWTNIPNLKWRRTLIDPMAGLKPHWWQTEILAMIKEEPDNRKVYWYWSTHGGVGKSCLGKSIVMRYNAVLVGGSARDIYCAIKLFTDEKDIDVVIFDIPRSSFNRISYNAIEAIKNGLVFSPKYESGCVTFNSPHCIVFANFPPDVSQLSSDRWVIKQIH